MNFSKGTSTQAIDHSQRRLLLGILFSIAFHALLLTMQFGVPGLDVPSLEMPWNKRSAEAPPITLNVNDVLPPPISQVSSPPPVNPEPQPESELDTLTPAPPAPTPVSKGFTLVDPRPAPPPTPPTPATPPAPSITSKATAPTSAPTPRRPRGQERKVTPFIAKELESADSFYVPAVDSEDKIGTSADLPEVANGDPNGDDAQAQNLAAEQLAKELAEKELAVKELAAKELAAKEQALAQAAAQREAQERATRAQEMAQLAAEQEQVKEKLRQEVQRRQQAELAEKAKQAALVAQAEEKRQQLLRQEDEARKLAQRLQEEEARKAAQRQLEKQQELAKEQARIQAENEARAKAAELAKAQAEVAAANAAREAKAQAEAAARAAANAAANANANANPSKNSGNTTGSTAGNTAGNSFVLPKNIGGDLLDNAKAQLKGVDLSRNPAVVRSDDAKLGRRSIFGSLNQEVPVRMYVEAWQQKIERNGRLNYSQLARDRARGDPIVSVTIRSDGSLEDITILHSSGQAEIDEAVRRIVRLNSPFAPFPKNVAARYDQVEIRRIWRFDETLKLIEEIR